VLQVFLVFYALPQYLSDQYLYQVFPENIVSNIMGKLVINLKKEIKQEIMAEVGKETTKMRNEYNAKILNMGGRIDVLEFDNANLIERNSSLHFYHNNFYTAYKYIICL
jgi:hypothetical protein